MKVGLLTVYFADYGSYYHSTALYHQLAGMGHQVELIHESYRYAKSPRLLIGSIASKLFPKSLDNWLGRKVTAYNTYRILKNDLARISIARPRIRRAKRYSSYDCVVVGSDELWSITNPNIRCVPDCFGIGITVPHVSYATSGVTLNQDAVQEKWRRMIQKGLKSFLSLSCRDNITKNWVEEWMGCPCKKVLDPTLLNPYFVEHEQVQPIVVVYGEHFSEEQRAVVVDYARSKGYKLLAIAWRHGWCNDYLVVTCAQDVQKAFSSASYCAVSTFHGTIFSILAHRPFISFISEMRGAKIKALLEDLGLEDRIYREGGIPERPVDYDAVEAILSEQRLQSLKHLKDALDQCAEKGGSVSVE